MIGQIYLKLNILVGLTTWYTNLFKMLSHFLSLLESKKAAIIVVEGGELTILKLFVRFCAEKIKVTNWFLNHILVTFDKMMDKDILQIKDFTLLTGMFLYICSIPDLEKV